MKVDEMTEKSILAINSGRQEIDVSKLRVNKKGKLLTFDKPTVRKKTKSKGTLRKIRGLRVLSYFSKCPCGKEIPYGKSCCRGHAAYIKKQRNEASNEAWKLKFQQDGIIAQQAFEAQIRYLNRLYYGKSSVRL